MYQTTTTKSVDALNLYKYLKKKNEKIVTSWSIRRFIHLFRSKNRHNREYFMNIMSICRVFHQVFTVFHTHTPNIIYYNCTA